MLDFDPVLHFSHTHCISICAVLVPLNLSITVRSLFLVGIGRPTAQVWQSAVAAIACALLMILHVATWFVVGVVMVPTFVLLTLGTVCLGINLWAVGHPHSLRQLLRTLWNLGQQVFQRVVQGVEAS